MMTWHRKRFRGASLTLAILVWVLFASVFAQDAAECTVSVHPGESIQEAIDQAAEETVICLSAGTWEGNLKIEKSLIVRGAGKGETIVKAAIEGCPVIWIEGTKEDRQIRVAISDLTIIGGYGECQTAGICADGLLIRGTGNANLTDCVIRENYGGIRVLDSAQATVTDSVISENGFGVGLVDSAQATVTGCTISMNKWHGILVLDSAHTMVADCSISENNGGINLFDSSQTTISACTISDNTFGIGIVDSAQATVSGCTISENRDDGIWLADTSQATIDHNKITSNGKYGIALYQHPCYETNEVFTGHLNGSENLIPAPDDLSANKGGTLCPGYPGDPWPDGFLKEE